MTTVTGGCLCGAIRYECSHELSNVIVCHCSDCRRASGTAASHNAAVPAAAIRFTRGEPRIFSKTADSGRVLRRYFCGDCGSPLFSRRDSTPEVMVLRVGSLDEPQSLRIAMNIWTRSAQPWVFIDESLPAHEGNRPT